MLFNISPGVGITDWHEHPIPNPNGLDNAQYERLALLAEECAEVIQVIGKILRHGYDSASPVEHELGQETNRKLLEKELGDIILAAVLMTEEDDINEENILERVEKKAETINQYLHYNQVKLDE